MYCIYLRKRHRKGVSYTYCTIKQEKVELYLCKTCGKKEFKRVHYLKSVGKSRKTVSKETYNIVFERDHGRCRLCGRNSGLQLHHILYRSERKDLIDEPTNCIMLCYQCHSTVHSNKRKYQPILLEKVN